MEKYYDLKDVCKISGFKRITLVRHMRAGNLKFFKPKGSNALRFTEKQIEEFMNPDLLRESES